MPKCLDNSPILLIYAYVMLRVDSLRKNTCLKDGQLPNHQSIRITIGKCQSSECVAGFKMDTVGSAAFTLATCPPVG